MDWYVVNFDEMAVHRRVTPHGSEGWSDHFYWHDVIRVCFQAGGFLDQDEVFIFTNQKPESYQIPMEAIGAPELMGELSRRGLFGTALLLEAMQNSGVLYCHPKP
jgi:hypothetical protein